jgi:hypothetical protein
MGIITPNGKTQFKPFCNFDLSCPSGVAKHVWSSMQYEDTSVVDPWHIVVRIRIRTTDLRTGSGSGSCVFRQWLTRCQQKVSLFFQKNFAYTF